MRAMILGAGGMLGHDLCATAPDAAEVVPLGHRDLDITDYGAVERAVEKVGPDVIVNAAAYTAVDRAESEPEAAVRVNGEAVGHLGRVARAAGARVVHFSSDYVFDGTAERPYREDDVPHPVNAYGASKLAGELALGSSGADALIIRTQWLFGTHGRSFARTIWERARQGLMTKVVTDQMGSPSYTRDISRATWRLVERAPAGVFHLANAGSASWYDVARSVFVRAGRAELVVPCATTDYPTPARRPRHSVLSTLKAATILGGGLPSWSAALACFMEDLERTTGEPRFK